MYVVLLLCAVVAPCLAGVPILTVDRDQPEGGAWHIVGGTDVYPIGLYPWGGSLQVFVGGPVDPWLNNCGCVLVEKRYVLAAAQCAEPHSLGNLKVILGAHDLITGLDGQPEDYFIEDMIVHPNWTNDGDEGFPNDIAVLKLREDVNENNPYIATIDIARQNDDDTEHSGTNSTISGWGYTSASSGTANVLKHMEMPILTNMQCRVWWGPYINPGHICMFDAVNQDKGICFGDGGNPLIYGDPEGEVELIGLPSWMGSGCSTTVPSVATRIAYYRDWIDDTIDELEHGEPRY